MAPQVTVQLCSRGGLWLWEWRTSCWRDTVRALGGRKSILFPSLPEGYVSEWRTYPWLYLMRGLEGQRERNEIVSRDIRFGFTGSWCSKCTFWIAETEVRTVLAGYTFVIFVTQEGSCGNSRPAMDYGELLYSFSQPHKQTSGMRQEDSSDGGICHDWVHSPRMPLVGWITGEKTPRVKASLNTHLVLP